VRFFRDKFEASNLVPLLLRHITETVSHGYATQIGASELEKHYLKAAH
jgi:hypothetical protein